MREQYFKHRAPFDFNKDTNDIGRPFFWDKKVENNHFLNRLYQKNEQEFDAFYNYHLHFFLSKYEDGTGQEFFKYVWAVILPP
jgi:aminopeptidase C